MPGSAARRCPPPSLSDSTGSGSRSSGPTAALSIRRSPVRRTPRREDKRLFTDGNALPGVEVRLADDGEILSRGPDLCLGYTDDALTAKAFDGDGWYHTGDVGVFDEDGYLYITDRKSDIIIRGGENISAIEVEDVLLAMPGVAEAAVVAVPDDRLRRTRGGGAADAARVPSCPPSTAVRAHFEAGGRRPPEVARAPARRRRLPAHAERQGAEVQGARADPRAHCHDDGVRI